MTSWPLTVLLDLALRDEAAAQHALARALLRETFRREERDAAATELRAHLAVEADACGRASHAAAPAISLRAVSLQRGALHLAYLRRRAASLAEALQAREGAVAHACRDVAAQRDAVAVARVWVRALEARRDGWRAERQRMRERAEEAAADELISARSREES